MNLNIDCCDCRPQISMNFKPDRSDSLTFVHPETKFVIFFVKTLTFIPVTKKTFQAKNDFPLVLHYLVSFLNEIYNSSFNRIAHIRHLCSGKQ
jgi:hypothetical protein